MPLLYKREIYPQGLIGIWKIEEDEDFFLDQIGLYPGEDQQLQVIKGFRRLEWLACRHLVHLLSDRNIRGAIFKDPFGKPFLENSAWDISMSHSGGLAAVIAAPCVVGIDIQQIVQRITHLAPKFVHEEEQSILDKTNYNVEAAHVIWGVKESLYKAYGKGNIDFKKDLRIEHFDYQDSGGDLDCCVLNHHFTHNFKGHYQKIEDFIFVYIIEDLNLIAFHND